MSMEEDMAGSDGESFDAEFGASEGLEGDANPEALQRGGIEDEIPEFKPWYNEIPHLSPRDESRTPSKPNVVSKERAAKLEELFQKAKALYEEEAEEYAKTAPKTSEQKWLRTVMRSGTSADRSAAMTLAVQQSPFHGLRTLDTLLTAAKKKGRRECVMACETLKDLFVTNILPDRKLLYFRQQDFLHLEVTPQHLKYWYFEHEIKDRYTQFIQALEVGSKDTVAHHREMMIHFLFDLLTKKSEQEKVLLALIINKLGDPDKKVSSKMVYLLGQLLQQHPNMRGVVVAEVEVFLHRPHLSARAQYCSVIFLNQIILDKTQAAVAQKLISIYFTLFKQYVEREDVESKMLSAILTGVSRAIPFAKVTGDMFREHIDTLFRIVHVTSFTKSIQALLLLLQIFTHTAPLESTTEANIAEVAEMARMESRFYRALYAKIISPDLFNSAKQPVLLNVLFKALKVDSCMPRVVAIVKRLLQVCTYQKPPFVCGALFMISELVKSQPELGFYLRALDDHPEENHIADKWANKLHDFMVKEEKEDKERKEKEAEEAQAQEKEKEKEKAEQKKHAKKKGGKEKMDIQEEDGEESDEEEEREVISLLESNGNEDNSKREEEDNKEAIDIDKVVIKQEKEGEEKKPIVDDAKLQGAWSEFYDPMKREPEFANADKTVFWELRLLKEHYHPSVVKFSELLLSGESIRYEGNPLQDFTLMAFLERFSFRNPKKTLSDRGGSLMQPTSVPRWMTHEPVNKKNFLGMPESKIRAEEVFFYKFFKQKNAQRKIDAPDGVVKEDQPKALAEQYLAKWEKGLEGGRPNEEEFVTKVTQKVTEDGSVEYDGGYSYDELANMSDDDEEENNEDDWDLEGKDDKFYEELLRQELDNEDDMVDDGEDGDGSADPMKDFASVEEFAHLLEQSGQEYAGIHKKQLAWEFKDAKKSRGDDEDVGGEDDKIDLEAFGEMPEGKTSKKGARKRRREEDTAAKKALGMDKKRNGGGKKGKANRANKGGSKPSSAKRRRK